MIYVSTMVTALFLVALPITLAAMGALALVNLAQCLERKTQSVKPKYLKFPKFKL